MGVLIGMQMADEPALKIVVYCQVNLPYQWIRHRLYGIIVQNLVQLHISGSTPKGVGIVMVNQQWNVRMVILSIGHTDNVYRDGWMD